MDHTIKTRLLLRPLRSDIGTIRLAGMNKGGIGVGMKGKALHTFKGYTFNYTLNGHGEYRMASGRNFKVNKGDFSLSFPNIPYGCGTAPGEFWDELWFEFDGPIFDLMRKTGVLDPSRPVHHAPDSDYWFRRIFEIIPPVHLRQKTPPQVSVTRFASLLTEMISDSKVPGEQETAAPAEDWVEEACQLLSQHEKHSRKHAATVAKKLGFTYETFRKKFRRAIGFSPGQYHLDSRIDRAAALLHQGRQNIKEIALGLNFCDEFYFSRCFKRRFGQSPRAFRQRVRGG